MAGIPGQQHSRQSTRFSERACLSCHALRAVVGIEAEYLQGQFLELQALRQAAAQAEVALGAACGLQRAEEQRPPAPKGGAERQGGSEGRQEGGGAVLGEQLAEQLGARPGEAGRLRLEQAGEAPRQRLQLQETEGMPGKAVFAAQ